MPPENIDIKKMFTMPAAEIAAVAVAATVPQKISTFIWLGCRRDFNCLLLSIASVKRIMGDRINYMVVQQAGQPFNDAEAAAVANVADLWPCDDVHAHRYTKGYDGVWRIIELYALAIKKYATPYVTKIDSDMLMFANAFERLLMAGSYAHIAAGTSWGCYGAFQHTRADAVERLATLGRTEFEKIAWERSLPKRPDKPTEDQTVSKFIIDYLHLPVYHFDNDWKFGYFDAAHPKAGFDGLRYKALLHDVMEFGRRGEYFQYLGLDIKDALGQKVADFAAQYMELALEYLPAWKMEQVR